ncbi:MAG: hypothetical protein COA58_11425 [Bacteroidetes bacterium]|nr:MAG: hypothetical protein COA58_11425 [Bacteroidota bacterium]
MKSLNQILLLTVLFTSSLANGQLLRDRDVDETTVKPWIEDDIKGYEDRYIFQPNDGNFLIILVNDTTVTAQIHFPSHWSEGGYALESGLVDSSEFKFHTEYITLTGVKIINGKFYSDQYNGEFVTFNSPTIYQGIKVFNSWSIWPGYDYEIGVKRQEKLSDFFNGDYIEASTSILDSAYLSRFIKEELQIMRNEIYARYYYQFEEGGKMANYFSQKDWYSKSAARYKAVQHMLTWIELKNIELIKYFEERK